MARTRYLKKKSLAETLALFVDGRPIERRPAENTAVEHSLHRTTAEPVAARLSAPHYHGSAMDGIAVRAADTFGAGETRPIELQLDPAAAQAPRPFAYVDTGQALPGWANAVVMIENVYPVAEGRVAIREAAVPWQHVRLVGEDIVATEPLLPRGHRIRPFDIGALLAAGHLSVPLVPRPRVAIIPTGSELIEPGAEAGPGRIIEFNSRVVAAFVSEWGGEPQRLAPVADDPDQIRAAVAAAVRAHDIVVVIAGSSAGEHDYTVRVLAELGEVLVHGIDIMPGKPAICAVIGGKPVLGLPGYPVSAIIVCQQVLRPLLAKWLGSAPPAPELVRAVVPRKLASKLGLEEFVRVTLGRVGGRLVATPLARGAGVITTLVRADGCLRIPALSEGINAGEEVEVELLRSHADIANTIVVSGSHDLSLGVLEDGLKRRAPELKFSTANVGSLGGLLALKRGEAHVVGTHLLDPATGQYNLPDIMKHLQGEPIAVVHLVMRDQGLIVARGNPKAIAGLSDLKRGGVQFVNRQSGAGTRVLLDYELEQLSLTPAQVSGYEREEFTHMAVAVAVASGLADCGLGVKSAAVALGLDFIPVAREEYDLVFRRDCFESAAGQALLEVMRGDGFRAAVEALGGYDASRSGTVKELPPARRSRAKPRLTEPKRRAASARRSSLR
ncbi:MAG: molybdopterin biosynthesis protein [Deltaproteobacteria bacterium]|nr:molybdopterin biosynthesis protein [Deltaproteobacteria bacterium]